MTHISEASHPRPYYAVAQLIDRHGLWRVLRAVVAASLKARPVPRIARVDGLTDHLRHDIGLRPALPDRQHWPPPV